MQAIFQKFLHRESIATKSMQKPHFWIGLFFIFMFLFNWQILFKGYSIGPFDYLVHDAKPFDDFVKEGDPLYSKALQYKNLMPDVIYVTLPAKLTAVNMMKNGILPIWNPYILNGSPLFASVQAAVLYPLTVLYIIFPPIVAFNIYIISQFVMAFFFMFMLLQRFKLKPIASFVGSLSFSFCAYIVVWSSWGTLGHALLWLPLMLYCIDILAEKFSRKHIAILIFGLASSFFAGHTQSSIMTWGVSIVYAAYVYLKNRKHDSKTQSFAVTVITSFIIATLISSVQLLPSAEMYRESVRDLVSAENFYIDQTLYFSSYIQSFAPDFFGNLVTNNFWGKINYNESAIYFGALPLLFAVYAILRKEHIHTAFFATLAGLAFLISTQNPLSHAFYNLNIPLLSTSTFARYAAIWSFAGAVLAGFGFNIFLDDLYAKNKRNLMYTFGLSIILLLIFFWGLIILRLLPQNFIENITVLKRNSILPSAIIFSVGCAFIIPSILWPKNIRNLLTPVIPLALVVVLMFEMFRFGYKFIPFSPSEFFYPHQNVLDVFSELTDNDRYINVLSHNSHMIFNMRGFEAAEPLYNKNLAELARIADGTPQITDRGGLKFAPGKYIDRAEDLFSIGLFLDRQDQMRNLWVQDHGGIHEDFDVRYKEIWTDGRYKAYKNEQALPRQFVFYHTQIATDHDERIQKLIDPNFDYTNVAIVEDSNALLSSQSIASSSGHFNISRTFENPIRQEYSVETEEKGLFVVTDTFYPGWKVTIDNIDAEIFKVNHAFRGVLLEKGTHTVVFEYHPTMLYLGSALSLSGLIIGLAWLLKKPLRN